MSDYIYELVDSTQEDIYYPMGFFPYFQELKKLLPQAAGQSHANEAQAADLVRLTIRKWDAGRIKLEPIQAWDFEFEFDFQEEKWVGTAV